MAQEKPAIGNLKNPKTILVIVLLMIFTGATTYAIMSDISVQGLTVRMYGVSRSCSSSRVVTFSINNAQVWSTASIQTSLTHVTFSLAVEGVTVGTETEPDKSFSPGQSASYTLIFSNPTIDPDSLPAASHLILSVTSFVSAGIYSSYVTTSDSQTENFSGQTC